MRIWVGFSQSDTWMSKIIRWFSGGEISHCYIKHYNNDLGCYLVIHSDWYGVVFDHYDIFSNKNKVIAEFEFQGSSIDYAIQKAMPLLGKKYNYLKLFGWAWTIAARRWIKKKIENPIEDPKQYLCTDFCIRIMRDSKIVNLPTHEMIPYDLYMWIKENYEALKAFNSTQITTFGSFC